MSKEKTWRDMVMMMPETKQARRDKFAAAAMQALCSLAENAMDFAQAGSSFLEEISKSSIQLADAMIAELDKGKE